jgi:hypothetical protein
MFAACLYVFPRSSARCIIKSFVQISIFLGQEKYEVVLCPFNPVRLGRTLWNRVLIEKLIAAQLASKQPPHPYITLRFIALFARLYLWSLSEPHESYPNFQISFHIYFNIILLFMPRPE